MTTPAESSDNASKEIRERTALCYEESLFTADVQQDMAAEHDIWKREWIILAVTGALIALKVWLS